MNNFEPKYFFGCADPPRRPKQRLHPSRDRELRDFERFYRLLVDFGNHDFADPDWYRDYRLEELGDELAPRASGAARLWRVTGQCLRHPDL